jgi:hypothetical protein
MTTEGEQDWEEAKDESHGYGRDRRRFVTEVCELTSESLVGSYFHAGFERTGLPESQGVVVAEPQAGIYLVETWDGMNPDEGNPTQRLAGLEEMMEDRWTFYNSEDAMQQAWISLVTHHKEGVN